MNPFIKALRRLVPEEIKALLEKIDSIEDAFDSSYYTVEEYVRNARLTRLERFLLRGAIRRIERHTAMVNAMNIVINSRKFDRRDVFTTAGTNTLEGGLYASISASQLNTQMQLRIYEEAEKARQYEKEAQARQAGLAAQQPERKKVIIRRKPAGA
jgi:hypothetical protein